MAKQSVSTSQMPPEARLLRVLEEANRLCPLPAATQRVLELAQSDSASVQVIVQAIANDPTLAAGVLRVANSALFSGPKVAQLDAAVIRIGMRGLREHAAAMAVLASFRSHDGLQVILHDRSVLAASVATKLAKVPSSHVLASTAATCGLLSEIGAMVCLASDAKDFVKLWKESGNQPLERIEREKARYTVSSNEIGRRHLMRIAMPVEVADAIGVDLTQCASDTNSLAKITLLARHCAPVLIAAQAMRTGVTAKMTEQFDDLAQRIGFDNWGGLELQQYFREVGLLH